LVFDEPPGSYAICPICFWEDDNVQLRFPTMTSGPNKVSLINAQRNFLRFGASEERFISNVRKPEATDEKDPTWRPIDSAKDRFEEPITKHEQFAPYPDDATTLYYWRENIWLRRR
jgi:hypothetical protein